VVPVACRPYQFGRKLVEFGAVGLAFGHGSSPFPQPFRARHRHHTPATDRMHDRTESEYRGASTSDLVSQAATHRILAERARKSRYKPVGCSG
jgi:hypothetical protein